MMGPTTGLLSLDRPIRYDAKASSVRRTTIGRFGSSPSLFRIRESGLCRFNQAAGSKAR
jgi:hypothetical protein